MASTSRVGKTATTVRNMAGVISVVYHQTEVIKIDTNTRQIALDSGGWRSATTKLRMNQAIHEYIGYGCGISVYQDKGDWFVMTDNGPVEFKDGVTVEYGSPVTTEE